MTLANPSKALIALVALLSMVLLMALDRIEAQMGMTLVTAITFYAIGNGIGAKSNTPVEPIIGRKEKEKTE